MVVVQDGGIVHQRRGRHQQIGDGTPVSTTLGQPSLKVEGSGGHCLVEVKPGKRLHLLATGLVVGGGASRVEELERDDFGHVQCPVRGKGAKDAIGRVAVTLLFEGGLVGEVLG